MIHRCESNVTSFLLKITLHRIHNPTSHLIHMMLVLVMHPSPAHGTFNCWEFGLVSGQIGQKSDCPKQLTVIVDLAVVYIPTPLSATSNLVRYACEISLRNSNCISGAKCLHFLGRHHAFDSEISRSKVRVYYHFFHWIEML